MPGTSQTDGQKDRQTVSVIGFWLLRDFAIGPSVVGLVHGYRPFVLYTFYENWKACILRQSGKRLRTESIFRIDKAEYSRVLCF